MNNKDRKWIDNRIEEVSTAIKQCDDIVTNLRKQILATETKRSTLTGSLVTLQQVKRDLG